MSVDVVLVVSPSEFGLMSLGGNGIFFLICSISSRIFRFKDRIINPATTRIISKTVDSVATAYISDLHGSSEFAEDEDVVVDVDGDSDDGRVVDGLSLLAYGGEVGEGIGIGTSLAFVVVGPDTEGDGLELLAFPTVIGGVMQGQLH